MTSSEPRGESPYGQPGRRHGSARDLSRAVSERERGRRRLTAATATVSFASVVGAGVVAAVLPGSTHQAATTPTAPSGSSVSTGTGSSSPASGGSGNSTANLGSGSQSSGSSTSNGSDSSNSTGNSSNLQAPAYTPAQSSGGGQSTSGGSSPF